MPQGAGGFVHTGGSGGAAGASGGGGTAGSAGTGGSAGGGGSGGGPCSGVLHVTGTLAGSNVVGELGQPMGHEQMPLSWVVRVGIEGGGGLVIEGAGSVKQGDSVVGKAYLGTPVKSVLGGKHLVAAQAALTFGDLTKPIKLSGLSSVGSCPGSALPGSLTLCAGSANCKGKFQISGSLDTYPVSEAHEPSSHGHSGDFAQLASQDGGFAFHQGSPGGSGTGFFRWPATGAKAGVVLCHNAGTLQSGSGLGIELTIGSLTELGKVTDAKPLAGELTLVEKCP